MHAPVGYLEQLRLGQRFVNTALLLVLVTVPLFSLPAARVLQGVVWLACLPLAMIGVQRIASGLNYRPLATAIGMAALLLPGVNLAILLILNRRATTHLRRHGFRVRLLGARPRYLPPPIGVQWPETIPPSSDRRQEQAQLSIR